MNRIKKIMIIVISFGLIASPAIAGCILPDADFFYGVTVNAQGETSVSNGHSEADLKGEKTAPALPDDILAPDVFYGYRD